MEREQFKLVSAAVAVVADVVCAVSLTVNVYVVDILETQTTTGHIASVAQLKRLADGFTDFSFARRVQELRVTRAPADAGEARSAHVFVRRQIRHPRVRPSVCSHHILRPSSARLVYRSPPHIVIVNHVFTSLMP